MSTFENPFISVVVPTCNRATTLVECIESIIANDYAHYEIIIVDQSSNDDTHRRITEKFVKKSNVIYVRSNIKCSSNARNEGWRQAKGEIIAFTDDDATVSAGWLKAFASAFNRENNRVGMIGGCVIPVFDIPRPSWLPPEKDYLLPSFDAGDKMRVFPKESLPMSVNFALRREALEKTGGFDTRLGLKSNSKNPYIGGEDSFLAMRVKEEQYLITYQPHAIVYHPIIAKRLTRSFFLKRNFREGVTAIALENTRKTTSDRELSSHISWHRKRLLYLTLIFCKDFILPVKNRPRRYMLRAAEMAFSAGALHYSKYLLKQEEGNR